MKIKTSVISYEEVCQKDQEKFVKWLASNETNILILTYKKVVLKQRNLHYSGWKYDRSL